MAFDFYDHLSANFIVIIENEINYNVIIEVSEDNSKILIFERKENIMKGEWLKNYLFT